MIIGNHVYFGCGYEFGIDLANGKDRSVRMGQLIPRGDMTKQEAVIAVRRKWRGVQVATRELRSKLCVQCSFCQYFDHCDACPLRNPNGGRHCVAYFAASDAVKVIERSAKTILDVADKVEAGICDHTLEIEITSRGDNERYFVCQCGRHRTEPF